MSLEHPYLTDICRLIKIPLCFFLSRYAISWQIEESEVAPQMGSWLTRLLTNLNELTPLD